MITQKSMFIVAIALAGVSAGILAFKNSEIQLTEGSIYTIVIISVSSVAILVLYKMRYLILFSRKRGKVLNTPEQLSDILGIDYMTLYDRHIVSKRNGSVTLHSFFKVISVPYSIDDLNRERQVFVVGNFVRILSTLNFPFEIIPRILPISPTVYLNQIHKEINDLRVTLSAEGNLADSRRQARLRNLESLAKKLQEGESVRDVSFLIHIMVQGQNEHALSQELETNSKTLAAALESGLNVNAVRLERHEMLQAVQDFFRLTCRISPKKSFRMLVWALSFLIPLSKPKLPPISKLLSGVYLGRTSSGAIVSINQEGYINPHIVVLGTTGGGKSTTVKTLVSRRQDLFQTPTVFLDYAGEYGPWVSSRGGMVLDMSKNSINPFDLGRATLADRIRQLAEMFERVCEFETINQRFSFVQYLNAAYQERGFKIDDTSTWTSPTPNLSDVIRLIEKELPTLQMQRQAVLISLLSRIKELASGPFGIFGKSNISIESLMNGFVCVDLSKISNNSLKDAVSYTILQHIDSKMRLEGIQKELVLQVVIDEAWKLAKDPKSLPVVLIKEGRKYGYSIIISSQDATDDLAPQILSNAGTAIIHRITYPKYLWYLRESHNLTDIELERIRDLPVGEAFIKIGNDPRGFFARIDMEEPQKLDYSAKKTEILPQLPESKEILEDTCSVKLSKEAEGLLQTISEEPARPTTWYYKTLGISAYGGNKAKKDLEEAGMIESKELPSEFQLGRVGKLLKLSQKGMDHLGIRETNRHGGLVHKFLVKKIAERFSNYKTEIEVPIGHGKQVDLVIDDRIAVEVETRDFSVENIQKDLNHNYDKVIVVCSPDNMEKFRKNLIDCNIYDDRVCLMSTKEILTMEPGVIIT